MSEEWPVSTGHPDAGRIYATKLEQAQATSAEQAKMIEHLRGGATPGFTAVDMASADVSGRRSLAEHLIKQIAIEHPDQDTLLTVRYIAQLIALEAGL